jgi:hypothetical protein
MPSGPNTHKRSSKGIVHGYTYCFLRMPAGTLSATGEARSGASALLTTSFLPGGANFQRLGAANLTLSLALRVYLMGRMALVAALPRCDCITAGVATPQSRDSHSVRFGP